MDLQRFEALKLIRNTISVIMAVFMVMLCLGSAPVFAAAPAASSNSVTASIPLSQTVLNGSGTFNYTLTQKTDEGDENAPMPNGTVKGVYSFSLKDTVTGSIEITGSAPGTWYYVLTAVNADSEDYKYDVRSYRIGVKIYNDNGKLKTQVNAKQIDPEGVVKANSAHFKIVYPCVGDPSVTKMITDKSGKALKPETDTTFKFNLTPFDEKDKSAYPMPTGSKDGSLTALIKGAGDADFGTLEFTSAGTYDYKITETKETVSGYTYDETIYKVRYVVTADEDGDLSIKKSYFKVVNNKDTDEKSGDDVTFTNIYTPSSSSGSSSTKTKTTTINRTINKNTTRNNNVDNDYNSGTTSKSVKTGDPTPLASYMAVLIGAAAVLIILGIVRKKRKGDDQETSASTRE